VPPFHAFPPAVSLSLSAVSWGPESAAPPPREPFPSRQFGKYSLDSPPATVSGFTFESRVLSPPKSRGIWKGHLGLGSLPPPAF